MRSILGIGYGFWGHTVLRSVKSWHMRHLFDVFLTKTILSSQDGYFTFVMKLVLVSFCTSSSIATFFPINHVIPLIHCLEDGMGSMVRHWHTTLVSISGISEGAQANKSMFLLSRETSSSS